MINGVKADVSTAGPAISLAQTIADGGQPSEAAIIGGLAAATTLVLGPLAGAAVGAIGSIAAGLQSLMEDFFRSLGLYDQVPSYHYIGLTPTISPIPYGPTDPYWINVTSYANLQNYILHGDAHHPALSGVYDDDTLTLFESSYVQRMTQAQADAIYPPGGVYVAQTPFEKFFATILSKNLQYWANAQGYVPPRQLLSGAVTAWNQAHQANTTMSFDSPPLGHAWGAGGLLDSVVSLVLGPRGDAINYAKTGVVQRVPPITINTGSAVPSEPKVVALRLSSGGGLAPSSSSLFSSPLVKSVAVAGGIGVAGTAWYAHSLGIPFTAALKRLFR